MSKINLFLSKTNQHSQFIENSNNTKITGLSILSCNRSEASLRASRLFMSEKFNVLLLAGKDLLEVFFQFFYSSAYVPAGSKRSEEFGTLLASSLIFDLWILVENIGIDYRPESRLSPAKKNISPNSRYLSNLLEVPIEKKLGYLIFI